MANYVEEYQMFRERPLVKNGSIMCYGDPSQGVVAVFTILTTKEFKGKEIPDLIFIQVIDTKTNEVLKQSERNGLYNALDLGSVWLERELKKS